CFLRAYPDDRRLLALVERMLAGFDRRPDLRRHRRELAQSGIAGTVLRFRFFAAAAERLARRWGQHLTIDWESFDDAERLRAILPALALYAETPALAELPLEAREWLRRLKGPKETDAAFLLRRWNALPLGRLARETFYNDLDPPLELASG